MDEKELRKLLGDKTVDEIIAYAKELKAKGMSPDEIGRALRARFPTLPVEAKGVGIGRW